MKDKYICLFHASAAFQLVARPGRGSGSSLHGPGWGAHGGCSSAAHRLYIALLMRQANQERLAFPTSGLAGKC